MYKHQRLGAVQVCIRFYQQDFMHQEVESIFGRNIRQKYENSCPRKSGLVRRTTTVRMYLQLPLQGIPQRNSNLLLHFQDELFMHVPAFYLSPSSFAATSIRESSRGRPLRAHQICWRAAGASQSGRRGACVA